jgi:PAS domain-containing protein
MYYIVRTRDGKRQSPEHPRKRPPGASEQRRSCEMSDRRIEDILESITEAFVAVDHEWRYTYINERALRRMQQR